jgi:two-component system OmpR family response regulator
VAASPHVLIVDDDKQIRTSLGRFLVSNGIRVTEVGDDSAMWSSLELGKFDLIVLDVMMPGEDGLSLCRRLRATRSIPVVLLTAMSAETDRIIGLEIGADDYVTKPFSPRELLARIRAVLRRTQDTSSKDETPAHSLYEFDGWRLDTIRRVLRNREDVLVDLTAGEFDLLLAFIERPQQVLTRNQLLDLTRGRASAPFDRSIDVQLSRLRRKIEKDPQQPALIKTVRSGGYIFTAPVEGKTQQNRA